MTLGTSFIQEGVIKPNKRNQKSLKDKENMDESQMKTDDVEDELLPATTNNQSSYSSPTSSALVHIGQNIYIEEPGELPEEHFEMPTKVERRSRRDYPDKVNRTPDELVNDNKRSVENITSTLLPRDLREQSLITNNSPKMQPVKAAVFKEPPTSVVKKQRDISTSSLLRNRYSKSNSFDSPQSIDSPSQSSEGPPQSSESAPQSTETPPDSTDAPSSSIRQKDPSTSNLLRNRYSQNMDDHTDDIISTSVVKKNVDDELANFKDSLHAKLDGETNDDVVKHSESAASRPTSKKRSPPPAEFRDKMDWLERTYNTRDHEYEPIGESIDTVPIPSTSSQRDSPQPTFSDDKVENPEDNSADASSITSHERKLLRSSNTACDEEADDQDRIEERFSAPTPQTDHSRNDGICTSQVDSSAIEDLPLRREDRRKGFMASTSDKTRNVQRKLRNQAGRLKSKFKEMQKPKEAKEDDSPKSERKRFRSPEFKKLKNIKMPKISKPELKRPEFTKFNSTKFKKPEFFKKYDGFSSLRLNRKKSSEPTESISEDSRTTRTTEDASAPTKKRFDFGTYPRIFDRIRRENRGGGGTTISRDTEPDEDCDRMSGPVQFATVPRPARHKGPKWKSNVSYPDDESSSGKFKHYSLDRESSVEKRMRLDFKDSIDAD